MSRILIVDDEKPYRNYLSEVVALDGHEVKVAATGREAIEVGTGMVPDVLVADWRLPTGQSGLEVGVALKKVNPQLRVIMITGYSAKDLREAAKFEIAKVLEKPFDLEDVVLAVREVLA